MGIIGASGYAGAELLRLLSGHPELQLAWATGDTQAGTAVAELYPSLLGVYPDLMFREYNPADAETVDVVFLALPHGKSQELVPDLRKRVSHIVDVAADFRLKDAALYPTWYGEEHACPHLLAQSVYGLPELHRHALVTATLIAVPGCYPTAATLALEPLVRHHAIERTGVVVNASCGVSGAGRTLSMPTCTERWRKIMKHTGYSPIAILRRWSRTSVLKCSSPLTCCQCPEEFWPRVTPGPPEPPPRINS